MDTDYRSELRDDDPDLTATDKPGGYDFTTPRKDVHRGALRFAERFNVDYAGKFLHVANIGWHVYDGTRWAECHDGAEVRAVYALLKAARAELADLNGDGLKDMTHDIVRVESTANGVHGVLKLAESMPNISATAEQLDGDPSLVNTAAGTVDIITGKVTAPNPRDLISKVTRAGFDTSARSEVFDTFLAQAQPDPEMRAFLARSLGSALLGRVQDHVLLMWHGRGANGKGTLRDAVRHALGDYAIEVPAEILLQSKYGQQGLAPERMRLKGARFAFCSEIAQGAKLDEATMKKLTGGDPVNAKLLYRNPIEFDPSHTLFMLTNFLPTVRGDDPAVWRRILTVPFDVICPADQRDPDLPHKLKDAAPAILAWLWEGWRDYQRNGLNPPKAVLDATRKYQLDSDVLARFLADEEAVTEGHGSVPSATLYHAFLDWARSEGEEVQMSNKAFTEAMTLRGFTKRKTGGVMMWQGIILPEPPDRHLRVV